MAEGLDSSLGQAPSRPRTPLRARRCVRHVEREAAGSCRECHGDFCRECLVEHEGRLLCATCLTQVLSAGAVLQDQAKDRRSAAPAFWRVLGTLGSFLMLWLLFCLFGRLLLKVPANFHENTLWKELEEVEE